jgi:hypothetical protein
MLKVKEVSELYPLFTNFRDISLVPNGYSDDVKIKEGLIYRSASLSRCDLDIVLQFLRENDINRIIDLRGIRELKLLSKHNNVYEENFKEISMNLFY